MEKITHKENLSRLNRIAGQIEGIKKMIEDGRDCPDIISQLRAVRSAVKSVESNILEKHLPNVLWIGFWYWVFLVPCFGITELENWKFMDTMLRTHRFIFGG